MMRYPEQLIKIMREDLTSHGFTETRTKEDVDKTILESGNDTVLMVVNSVCGCAAGKARPGIVSALENGAKPDRIATVFAGADIEGVARVRELAPGIPPSSPAVYLFQNGKPIYSMPRQEIETRQSFQIAELLKSAFDKYCPPVTKS